MARNSTARWWQRIGVGGLILAGLGLAGALWLRPAQPAAGVAPLSLPPGFVDELVVGGLLAPRDVVFAPDGRIFILERGSAASSDINLASVRVFKNGALLPTRALTLSVCGDGERGLLGIALDPNFAANGYFYLYYTRQSPSGAACGYNTYTQGVAGPRNRVSRFTLAGDVADPASERVLVDNIATDSGIHNAGDLQFGADGYLYVSVGDSNIIPSPAQYTTNLNGKILRLLPDPGPAGGYSTAGNPFDAAPGAWDCGTNPPGTGTGPCREIYAYGLRNPFRFTIKPGTSTPFIGDVGGGAWEEVDQGVAGGNFGYPFREGPCSAGSVCSLPQPPSGYVDPLYAYPHVVVNANYDSAVIGGDFYTGTRYPAAYQGSLFFADFVQGWIRRLTYDAGTQQWSAVDFAAGGNGIVGIVADLNGDLNYLSFASDSLAVNELHRIRYQAGGNQAPVAQLSAAPLAGPLNTVFTFSAAGSVDPDGSLPLTYTWNLGNGPAFSTATLTTTTAYTLAAPTVVTLTVTDSGAPPLTSAPVTTTVYPGSVAPTATIVLTNTTAPGRGLYNAGDTWQFGVINVQAGGPLAAQPYAWDVVFHHRSHTHPFLSNLTGDHGQFTIPTSGEADPVVWYAVVLRITDAQGLVGTVSVDVNPQLVPVSVDTAPSGGVVLVDNQTLTAPAVVTKVVNITSGLDVPAPQTIAGQSYGFGSWSDGGAQFHAVSVPAAGGAYTATLSAVTPPANGNLLVNGGFETGDFTAWTVVPTMSVSPAAAAAGTYGAALTGDGRLDQVFTTTIGQTYTVSAQVRLDAQPAAPTWGGLRVQVSDANWTLVGSSLSLTAANTPLGQWTTVQFTFVAATVQSRLLFENFSDGQFLASADNFVVQPSPVPPTATPPPATATPPPTSTPGGPIPPTGGGFEVFLPALFRH